jgi:hypothetical protein
LDLSRRIMDFHRRDKFSCATDAVHFLTEEAKPTIAGAFRIWRRLDQFDGTIVQA